MNIGALIFSLSMAVAFVFGESFRRYDGFDMLEWYSPFIIMLIGGVLYFLTVQVLRLLDKFRDKKGAELPWLDKFPFLLPMMTKERGKNDE